jgi:hypothetical protein
MVDSIIQYGINANQPNLTIYILKKLSENEENMALFSHNERASSISTFMLTSIIVNRHVIRLLDKK